MTQISTTQIKEYRGGNFNTLADYLDRREVVIMPYSPSRVITVSGASFALLNSTIMSGNLAIGNSSTTNNGGIQVASLAGVVGTGAINSVGDSNGNLINLVNIRLATTNDPVLDSNGKTIYGLIQCSNTATDGNAVAASGSENTQISFVTYDETDALTLVTVSGTVEFQINRLYSERNKPALYKSGTAVQSETLLSSQVSIRRFIVTTAFSQNEVLTLSSGAGSIAGASTASGDTITLPSTSGELYASNKISVKRNGVEQKIAATGEFKYSSTSEIITVNALEIGEELSITIIN